MKRFTLFSFLVLAMLISVFLVFFTGYAEPIFLDETPNTAIKFPGARSRSDVYLIILPCFAIRPEFDRTLTSDYGIGEATLRVAEAIMERHTPRVPVGVFLRNPTKRLNIPNLSFDRWGVDSSQALDRLLRQQQNQLDAKRRCLSKRQLDVRSPLSLGSPYRLYTDNWFQGRLFMEPARNGVGCGYVIGDPYDALAYMFADTIGLQKNRTEKITIDWLLSALIKVFEEVIR